MAEEPSNQEAFDWSEFKPDLQDPKSAEELLLPYVEHLDLTGCSEDAIRERLAANGVPLEFISGVLVALRQRVRNRDQARQDRRASSARLASAQPDPAFALEGALSYGQVLAQRTRPGRNKTTVVVWLLLIVLLFLLLLAVGAFFLDAFQ
jgi:hypothetical protein